MKKLVFLIMFGIFFGITAKGMADTSQSVMCPNAQSYCDVAVRQKLLELFNQQEKNNAASHERELKNLQSAEQLQNMKMQAQKDQMQSHDKYLKDLDRVEADNDRFEKILATDEINNDRFEKILSTWEHQQQQYQRYLDRLKQ